MSFALYNGKTESTPMIQQTPNPPDLVRTEAEPVPPPDVTVPEPQGSTAAPTGAEFDPDILAEVKRLSDRVGGLEKLRDLVEALLRFRR
jgi:hypothetical protein